MWTNNSLQGNCSNTDNIDDKIIKTKEMKEAIKKVGISPAEGNLNSELYKYVVDWFHERLLLFLKITFAW